MNGVFTDADVLNTTYKTVDYIEKWIRDYCDIDYEAKHRRLRIRNDSIYTTFDIPGKEFERLGIRLNKQNVISLISSNAIWNNRPEMVIRELLQNSVEACRYRKNFSPPTENYSPNIDLIFDKEENSITIIDNGCGMSRSTISNNFLTVGNSRAKEPDYANENYASLARFGIGFWSVFTIAEKAIIETAKYKTGLNHISEGVKFEVSINPLKDYLLFEQTRRASGTLIKIILKSNVNQNELVNKIRGYFGVIICSDIPIIIKFGKIYYTLPATLILPSLKDIFGAKISYIFQEGVELFSRSFCEEDVAVDSFIIFRKNDNTVSFLFSSGDPISITPSHYEVKAICGFTIRFGDTFPIYELISGSMWGYIANTKNPKGFEYNINRQSLLYSTEATKFSETIIEKSTHPCTRLDLSVVLL